MALWLETIGIVLVIFAGIVLGRRLSGFKGMLGLVGVIFSLAGLVGLIAAKYVVGLTTMPLVGWLTLGRPRFIILALAITVGTIPLHCRASHRACRYIICIMMIIFLLCFTVLPFLAPAVLKEHLSNIITKVDDNGICLQTRNYTCGPAAAVTAIRKLGLSAEEGEMAVHCRTSPMSGTLAWSICRAIESRYGKDGLECEYRKFETLEQLRNSGITMVAIKQTFMVDHWVTVLDVSDKAVIVADPFWGRRTITIRAFEEMWRYSGIVLQRTKPQNS